MSPALDYFLMLAGVELLSQTKIHLLKIATKKLQDSYFQFLNMAFNVIFTLQIGRQLRLGLQKPYSRAMNT
jgi:hypothetical protein